MHAALTRASQHHQGGRRRKATASLVCGIAGCLLLALPGPAADGAAVDTAEPFIAGSLPRARFDPATGGVPHELNVEHTRPGTEALVLSARLREMGGLIRLPIHWRVYQLSAQSGARGAKVQDLNEPMVNIRLTPGDYLVEADYGLVSVGQQVTVPAERHIGLTLILNVGGIRPLSTVRNAPDAIRAVARHEIYSVGRFGTGERLAGGIDQGEIVRLGAGSYRIVSVFHPGNTLTEQTVRVKPGMLTSLELTHDAAIANIVLSGSETGSVNWRLRQRGSDWSAFGSGTTAQIVLAPGTYDLTATINGRQLSREFAITTGQTAEITLQ